ncbi:hypothetical protein WJX81_001920 [Elliptochloris bilobata]|uniref:PWI domain-containing protein n=1 Tax=Elliptochloris bilobata TaxID=381761 RepID=A0AAW1QVB2_9CHLO
MPYPGMRPPFLPGPLPLPLPRPTTLQQPLARPPTLAKPTTGGPEAAALAAAPAADASAALPGKATTLYVGKIALSVEEEAIRALLEACGPVKSWKRMTDPSTGAPKGFGFCEYEEVEGVLCALRLLNNLKLDGQELLLKTNTATQRYIEAVEKQRAAAAAAAAAARAHAADNAPPGTEAGADAAAGATSTETSAPANGAGSEDGEHGLEPEKAAEKTEEERDNDVLERVMALVSERAAAAGGGSQREAGGPAADADSFLSSLHHERRGGGSRGDRSSGGGDRRSGGEDRSERAMEAEFAREREMERKEHDARAREADRLLKERTRDWERHERDVREAAEREHEREKDAARERARLLRADLEDPDSDDDEPRWRRKPLVTSRRALARKWHRQREEEDDAADRAAEAQERGELPGPPDGELADGFSREGNGAVEAVDAQAAAAAAVEHAARQAQVDRDDPIYQAMMAAAKAPPRALPPPPGSGMAQAAQQQTAQQQAAAQGESRPQPAAPPPAAAAKPAQPRKRPLLAAFGDDDDDKPKRVLRTIQYTEEELRAMKAREAERVKPEDAEAALKELIRSIPTDREAVFAYPVKWGAFDAATAVLQPKLSAWINKKIKELLGVEEPSMVTFIIDQLKKHVEPASLLEELQAVLDEEAPGFVLKLFRSVIFDTEKQALGLLEGLP